MNLKKRMLAIALVLCLLCSIGVTVSAQEGDVSERTWAWCEEQSQDDPEWFKQGDAVLPVGNAVTTTSNISDNTAGYTHKISALGTEVKNGIDVSSWQDDIDWNSVAGDGISFALIRGGYTGYGGSTLNTHVDTKAIANVRNAAAAGLAVGMYYYTQATTVEEAVTEANLLADVADEAGKQNITLPLVLDFEYPTYQNTETGRLYKANLTKKQNTELVLAFLKTLKSRGYEGMLYANKNTLTEDFDTDQIEANYKIWLANYTKSTTYTGNYDFWQYREDGTVNGITGNVDMDFWYTGNSIPNKVSTIRLSGSNRYSTATSVANALLDITDQDTFDAVVIAYGLDYADALSGSYLAIAKNAPILLADSLDTDSASQQSVELVKTYLSKHLSDKGKIYVLGGNAVVSTDFKTELSSYGTVVSLAGKTRFETNLAILKEACSGKKDTMIFCSASSYPDAVSASALGCPVMLVGQDGLTADQVAFAKTHAKTAYVMGGEAAVSEKTYESISTVFGTDNTKRYYGQTRYGTSLEIAKLSNITYRDRAIVLAYGGGFADALCAGPLAYAAGAPLILAADSYGTDDTALVKNYVSSYCYNTTRGYSKIVAVGGTGENNNQLTNQAIANYVK